MRNLLLVTALGLVALSTTAQAVETAVAMEKIQDAQIDRWDPAMDAIVPKDWKIEKVAEGFGWAEGPIWVKKGGYLLFTDVPGNKMWKWSESGGLVKFLDPSGAANPDPAVWREAGANGLAINDGKSLVYADTGNRMIQN
jgi:gluconolactonase